MIRIEELVAMVQASAETGFDVSTTYRHKGPWLEIMETGDEDCWVYWVRHNNLSAKGYDVVEHPSDNPDQMDLDLAHYFPKL